MAQSIQDILESKTWTFAKTMPRNPHFWSAKKDWDSAEEYETVFHYINEHGEQKVFGGRAYSVLFINGWRYWTMTKDVSESRILNRAEGEI